jgi:hypothetical protein
MFYLHDALFENTFWNMNLLVIWNFSFDITKSSEIVSINESTLILEIIGQCDIGKHDVTDKKNNVNFERLYIHDY